MSFPRQTNQDDESYKPITFTQYVWERCKSQPLIPIGESSRLELSSDNEGI